MVDISDKQTQALCHKQKHTMHQCIVHQGKASGGQAVEVLGYPVEVLGHAVEVLGCTVSSVV